MAILLIFMVFSHSVLLSHPVLFIIFALLILADALVVSPFVPILFIFDLALWRPLSAAVAVARRHPLQHVLIVLIPTLKEFIHTAAAVLLRAVVREIVHLAPNMPLVFLVRCQEADVALVKDATGRI